MITRSATEVLLEWAESQTRQTQRLFAEWFADRSSQDITLSKMESLIIDFENQNEDYINDKGTAGYELDKTKATSPEIA